MKYILDESLETEYLKENYIGKVFDSNKFGKFKVLGVKKGSIKYNHLLVVEFLNTQYQTFVKCGEITRGYVKDRFAPSIAGVGYLGDIKIDVHGVEKGGYDTWLDMIHRCYHSNRRKHWVKYTNCTVEEHWHNFSNFLIDCYELPNAEFKFKNIKDKIEVLRSKSDFLESENLKSKISNLAQIRDKIENDKFENSRWQLDKDILKHGNKIYSKETCCWIPDKINAFFNNIRSSNTSGFEGVQFDSKRNTFKVVIQRTIDDSYKFESLGTFTNPIGAYEAYSLKRAEILEDYLEEYWYMNDDVKNACRNKLCEQTKETLERNSDIINSYSKEELMNDSQTNRSKKNTEGKKKWNKTRQ